MFLKLMRAGSVRGPWWVRADHIVSLVPDWYGTSCTRVSTAVDVFEVVETPEEIMKLISDAEIHDAR